MKKQTTRRMLTVLCRIMAALMLVSASVIPAVTLTASAEEKKIAIATK